MKNPKNVEFFMSEKELVFENSQKLIEWVKRNMKLDILVKVGPNYLADEEELEKAFQDYLKKKTGIYKKRVEKTRKKN